MTEDEKTDDTNDAITTIIGIPAMLSASGFLISIIAFGFTWDIKILTGAITLLIVSAILFAICITLEKQRGK